MGRAPRLAEQRELDYENEKGQENRVLLTENAQTEPHAEAQTHQCVTGTQLSCRCELASIQISQERNEREKGGKLGAICAAPRALAAAGVIEGRTITSYPGTLDHLDNKPFINSGKAVETDGNIVTSRGPGTAMDFALELIGQLGGQALRDQIAAQMVREQP